MSGEAGGRAWREDAAWWPDQPLIQDESRSQHLFSYKMASGFGDGTVASAPPPAPPDYRIQPHWWYAAGPAAQPPPPDSIHMHAQQPPDESSPMHQQQNQNQSNQHNNQNNQNSVTQQQNQVLQQTQQAMQQQIQNAQQMQNAQQLQSAQMQPPQQLQQSQQMQSSQLQSQQMTQQQHQQLQSVQHQQLQSQQIQNQQMQMQQGLHVNQNQMMHSPQGQHQPHQQAKSRPLRTRTDSKPRGRVTAYAYFVQTCREEHKKEHPDENVIFADFSKRCSEKWRTMLDKEKQRFHEMAEQDKKRYDLEMQSYVPPKGEKLLRGRKRKHIKDPNAPKKSLSAFFWFCNDERSKVKALNPDFGVGNIAKELGRRWADCDPETKSKYEALSEKDKARYNREMTAYKKKLKPDVPTSDDVPEDEEPPDENDEFN